MPDTNENLKEAFAGESQANRKYTAYAIQADKDGFPNVAKLFRTAAEAEDHPRSRTSESHGRHQLDRREPPGRGQRRDARVHRDVPAQCSKPPKRKAT